MSSPEDNPTQRALAREWAAARIVVIGGLVVALAVAGYFAYRARQAATAEQQASAAAVAPKKVDAKALARAELAVCSAELARAKEIKVIPQYSGLASPKLVATNVERRFVCIAATHLTRYLIAADLRCNNLADPQCVSIYRVALNDGTLLYSRPE